VGGISLQDDADFPDALLAPPGLDQHRGQMEAQLDVIRRIGCLAQASDQFRVELHRPPA
jgi:hypothetical protein